MPKLQRTNRHRFIILTFYEWAKLTKVKKTKINNQVHRFEFNENTKLWTHKQVSSIDNFLKEPILYDDLNQQELNDLLSRCHRVDSFET